MIRTQQLLEQQRQRRLDGKSLEFQFQARLIEEGRCSPILARAIWGIAQEAFGQKLDQQADQLRLGQLLFLAVDAHEPAGKPVAACQKVTVRLTLDADKDDFEVRIQRGLDAVRRARILRLCTEAREQGALLSYEDLAFKLLNCGTRTIVRDVAVLRAEGIVVPSRGQQQDIGPGQTHRVQAVEWFLKGWGPRDEEQIRLEQRPQLLGSGTQIVSQCLAAPLADRVPWHLRPLRHRIVRHASGTTLPEVSPRTRPTGLGTTRVAGGRH